MILYSIITKIKKLIDFLEKSEKTSNSLPKNSLIKNLRCLFIFSLIILKDFRKDEEIKHKVFLTSSKRQNKEINLILKKSFVDKILKRTLIFQTWAFFEDFLQKETSSNEICKNLLDKYFDKNIPLEINFLLGLRNSLHSNGIYKDKKKQVLIYKMGRKSIYKLEDNKQVPAFNYDLIIDITKKSFNSLR